LIVRPQKARCSWKVIVPGVIAGADERIVADRRSLREIRADIVIAEGRRWSVVPI
jgi:hypothetical protein